MGRNGPLGVSFRKSNVLSALELATSRLWPVLIQTRRFQRRSSNDRISTYVPQLSQIRRVAGAGTGSLLQELDESAALCAFATQVLPVFVLLDSGYGCRGFAPLAPE